MPLPPCPCGGACRCHRPRKGKDSMWPVFLGLGILFGLPLLAATCIGRGNNSPRIIYVNGQKCEIHYKQDGMTSTGASWGHDEAVCP